MTNQWMNHPGMDSLDPVKLELIKKAASQVKGKKGSALATVLLPIITAANRNGIQFSPDEISLILDILKQNKTEAEIKQIDQMIAMISNYKKKGN